MGVTVDPSNCQYFSHTTTTMSLSRFLGGRVVLLARARVNSRAGMSTKPNPPALPEFDTAKDIGLLHLWPVLLGVAVITSMSLYVSPFLTARGTGLGTRTGPEQSTPVLNCSRCL